MDEVLSTVLSPPTRTVLSLRHIIVTPIGGAKDIERPSLFRDKKEE